MKRILSIFLSVLLVLNFVAVSAVSALSFNDVTSDQLYYDAIEFLKGQDAIVGYSDGTFGYSNSINRAELLKIVVESRYLFGGFPAGFEDFSDDDCFSDVPAGEWYTKYVCYAKDQGWIVGYSDGTFKPAQYINFVEALKIVLEVYGLTYDETPIWYKGLVDAASSQNLIPPTIFSFDWQISRAEMVEMIVRKVKYDEGVLDEFLGECFANIVKDYSSIGIGFIMEFPPDCDACVDDTCGDDADATADGIFAETCYFNYNVVSGTYTGFTCDENTTYDLSGDVNFQGLFEDFSDYISGYGAVVYDDVLYFTKKVLGGDVAVYNQLLSYNPANTNLEVMYTEEDLNGRQFLLLGIDTDEDLLILTWDSDSGETPECWTQWTGDEWYSYPLYGSAESLVEYEVPQWKIDEQNEEKDTCWASWL
jgi:hypothetical protein